MYFLRQLKKFELPKTMMVYTATIESILYTSIIEPRTRAGSMCHSLC